MSDAAPLSFAALTEGSRLHRQDIAARFGGKRPEPVIEDLDAKGEEANNETGPPPGTLTPEEVEAIAAKAETGDPTALAIIEKALEATPAPQAGDGGTAGGWAKSQDPWATANERIMRAFRSGRARQLGL